MGNTVRIACSHLLLAWVYILTVALPLSFAWLTYRLTCGFSGLCGQLPPAFLAWQQAGIWLLAALYIWAWVCFLFTPTSAIAKDFLGKPVKKTDHRRHPLSERVQDISFALSVPVPVLYIANHDGPNAFVMQDMHRSTLTVTTGLLSALDPQALTWVLAHEIAHIKSGDARVGRFEHITKKSCYALDKIRVAAFFPVFWLSRRSALLSLALTPVRLAGNAGFFLLVLGFHATEWVTSAASRHIESQADAAATQYIGPEAGARALNAIGGKGRLFAHLSDTHPTLRQRLTALKSTPV